MSTTPIAQHALLSDCGAAALVTSEGSVDWLCLPRFDSAPVLGRLLDDGAGHFGIAPVGAAHTTSRRYRPSSLVLETTWESPEGTVVLTEAMALGPHNRGHELGRSAPGVLLRMVRCTRGAVTMRVEYAPRPEFGLVHPRLSVGAGAVLAHGGSTIVVLSTELDMDIDRATASAVVTVTEGQDLGFASAQTGAWDPQLPVWSAREIRRGLAATEKTWQSWSQLHQRYEGPVRRGLPRRGSPVLLVPGHGCVHPARSRAAPADWRCASCSNRVRSGRRPGWTPGRRSGTPSSPGVGATQRGRSRSRSAPSGSTPRVYCWRSWGSWRSTTRGCSPPSTRSSGT